MMDTDSLGSVAVPFTKGPDRAVSYRSLPHKLQLAILCLARLADPLALTSVNVSTPPGSLYLLCRALIKCKVLYLLYDKVP